MQNQYLAIAESIIYKNNKLSCINIFDQFVALQLPAEFVFDMAVICGSGWLPGEYAIKIQAKTNDNPDLINIGDIKVNIPHENFVYNAIAQNLKLVLGDNVSKITFIVSRNDEIIIERTYPVNTIMVRSEHKADQEVPV